VNLRRTRAYIRLRKRVRRRAAARGKELAPAPRPVDHRSGHGFVLFDQRERQLPTATLVPREPGVRARVSLHELGAWLAARWSWVSARRVPLLVAAAGMMFVLMSADYLSHEHGPPAHHVPAFRIAP
jgi:hypothetical protein